MLIFWGAAVVILLIIEGATLGMTSIWFALGSLAALVCAALGAPQWLQIAWFAVISVSTLLLTRPLAMKYVNSRRQATNADRVIGKIGRVTGDIDNLRAVGAVFVDGKYWTARSESGAIISEGETVKILRIEGVKLFVELTGGQNSSSEKQEEKVCQQS